MILLPALLAHQERPSSRAAFGRPFLFVVLLCCLRPEQVTAQAPLLDSFGGPLGFGVTCLGANDDASSDAIDLGEAFPGGLRWGEGRVSILYVNNNGNVSFGQPLEDFTPTPFESLSTPVIAAYWADFDSRPTGCSAENDPGQAAPCLPEHAEDNTVWWHLEPGRVVVTWYRMGRYQCDPGARVSVQLVIESAGCLAAGDFDITFRHAQCDFTTGDASKSDGQSVHAQVGFGGGDAAYQELDDSRTDRIARAACESGDEPGVHRFSIRGELSNDQRCVGAGGSCDTGGLGVCSEGALSCEDDGILCVARMQASDEICDGLDNDCDGTFDETNPCEDGGCIAGNCAPYCTEGLCPTGLVCDGTFCVPRACQNADCQEGQYCRDGECVDACQGVFCPDSQSCIAGRCQDLCEQIHCDSSCEVCSRGTCIARCLPGDCEPGYSCIEGRCEQSLCLDVECAEGLLCHAGVCEAACQRVRCPRGYTCSNGVCELEDIVEKLQQDPGTRKPANTSSCTSRRDPYGAVLGLVMIACAIIRLRSVRGRGCKVCNDA